MRKLSLFILPAAIAVVLAACGGQAPTTTGEAPTTGALEEVEPTLGITSETGATSEAMATSDSTSAEASPAATADTLSDATSGTAGGGVSGATSTSDALDEATEDTTATSTSGLLDEATEDTTATSTLGDATATSGRATPDTTATSGTGSVSPTNSAGGVTGENGDVLAALRADGRFNTLVTAIEAAGLSETLQNSPQFTLFAPTDEAFAALPPEQLQALLADPQQLGDILLYHVVDQELMATDVSQAQSIPTLQGQEITVSATGNNVLDLTGNNKAMVVWSGLHTQEGGE